MKLWKSRIERDASKTISSAWSFSSALLAKAASRDLRLILMLLFLLGCKIEAQEVIDNFDLGTDVGWQHYTPTSAGGAVPLYSFPTNSSGRGYRMIGPPLTCQGVLQRGGAYRSEQYSEFFYSVDLLNFEPLYSSYALFGGRIGPPGNLVPLSTQGYMMAYLVGAPRQRQAGLVNIEFTSEVISTIVDAWRGGAVLSSVFPPSRQVRAAFRGSNDTFRGELYDRTDLLEPLVRINFQDFTHCTGNGPALHAQGENLLGWVNLADDDLGLNSQCDFTFDNYHATGNRNTAVGFPGVPQVINLVPGVQTLFYSIPSTNQITFNVATFSTTQVATNTLKLYLNDVDVSSGLAFTEVKTPVIGSPNTNFLVRWNGNLSGNSVYHGTIVALDTAGKGTTNNWYFDTFSFFNPTASNNPSRFLLIEAEDYNYGGGNYQDYPPVSGTDDTTTSEDPLLTPGCNQNAQETLGPQVNGGGVGYYNGPGAMDIVGMPDVDFHDNTTAGSPDALTRNQYRTMDRVGTIQATKGGGLDTPRAYRTGLTNNNSGTSYIPDYVVADMNAGDWMNYTRTFPNTNYQVYLRASSQGRQDVRFDEVTSDRTQPNQSTVLRGQFLVPNTESWTRWRYIPLSDAAGNPQTLSLQGLKTLRLTANEVRRAHTQLADFGDLQLNWIMFVPTPSPASSGPWIASAKPSKNASNFDPAGTVQIVILDRDTAVVPSSIQLRFDGSNVTTAATIAATTPEGLPGATVSYRPGAFLLPGSQHNISVVFANASTTSSNFWSFTVDDLPLLTPSMAVAGIQDTNFTVKMNKAANDTPNACNVTVTLPDGSPQSVVLETFGNNIARAERQLAGQIINPDTQAPFENEAAGTNSGQTIDGIYPAPVINFEQCGNSIGLFGGDTNFPGIDPAVWCNGSAGTASPDHFAMAASIKLSLAAGVYRMGVNSDDEFKVTAGGTDATNVYLGSSETFPGTTSDGQFDFVVQTGGIYNFRLVYEEGNGGAHCEWYWVNRTTGARELVRPVTLLSSTSANGAYSLDATAQIDPGTKTIIVPKSGNTRFYKLLSSTGYTFNKPVLSGNNIILSYQ